MGSRRQKKGRSRPISCIQNCVLDATLTVTPTSPKVRSCKSNSSGSSRASTLYAAQMLELQADARIISAKRRLATTVAEVQRKISEAKRRAADAIVAEAEAMRRAAEADAKAETELANLQIREAQIMRESSISSCSSVVSRRSDSTTTRMTNSLDYAIMPKVMCSDQSSMKAPPLASSGAELQLIDFSCEGISSVETGKNVNVQLPPKCELPFVDTLLKRDPYNNFCDSVSAPSKPKPACVTTPCLSTQPDGPTITSVDFSRSIRDNPICTVPLPATGSARLNDSPLVCYPHPSSQCHVKPASVTNPCLSTQPAGPTTTSVGFSRSIRDNPICTVPLPATDSALPNEPWVTATAGGNSFPAHGFVTGSALLDNPLLISDNHSSVQRSAEPQEYQPALSQPTGLSATTPPWLPALADCAPAVSFRPHDPSMEPRVRDDCDVGVHHRFDYAAGPYAARGLDPGRRRQRPF